MQYILTEEEYKQLQKNLTAAREANKDLIAKLCTRIANSENVSVSWIENGKPQPWGCIYTPDEDKPGSASGYCDECPVADVCPRPKNWSK